MPIPPIPPAIIQQVGERHLALLEAHKAIVSSQQSVINAVENPRLNPAMRRLALEKARRAFDEAAETYQRAWAALVESTKAVLDSNLAFRDALIQAEADLQLRVAFVEALEKTLRSRQSVDREEFLFFNNLRETWSMLTGRS